MRTRIHLVRHGLSQANLDLEVNRRTPDHAIELAPEGHGQARAAGNFLAKYILGIDENGVGGFHRRRVRLLVSPYKRTRQTAEEIEIALNHYGVEFDRREDNLLREQSFGLFDGIPDDELPHKYPEHFAYYQKHTAFEGEFFAPMPMGESRAMVCDRIRASFGTILRDLADNHNPPISDLVVVSHGVTIRCFIKEWLHRPWEWCENEPNPSNCSIFTIEGESGAGWNGAPIFAGFHHDPCGQERREEGHVGPGREKEHASSQPLAA